MSFFFFFAIKSFIGVSAYSTRNQNNNELTRRQKKKNNEGIDVRYNYFYITVHTFIAKLTYTRV